MKVLGIVRRTPFTLVLLVALVLLVVITDAHIFPITRLSWLDSVATGLPAFQHGHWWSLATSPWFVVYPVSFFLTMPVVIGAVGWAEWRFGTWRCVALFFAGHIVGSLGAAAALALASMQHGWHWAVTLSHAVGAGPASGALTCLIFAIATLPSPWRLRARIAVTAWAGISLVYLGHLSHVQFALVTAIALVVSGSLPAFRHPAGRPTIREWRLIAFSWLIIICVVEVFNLIPFDGPIGDNHPFLPVVGVIIDVVVVAIVAGGVRIGIRVAWLAALALAAGIVVGAVLGAASIRWLMSIGFIRDPEEITSVMIPSIVLWSVQLVILLLGRGAFHVRLRRNRRGFEAHALTRDRALARLRRIGGDNISWMLGWEDNQRIAVGSGVIGFQTHAGVAIALGDPIVPPAELGRALTSFANISEHAGYTPCVFSAGSATAAARPSGWRQVVVADEKIVDLPGMAFTGKRWNSVRTSLNRAKREGIEFRMCTLSEEPWSVLSQVRAISEQWAGDRGLPEMGFTLGTVTEALDPETRVGLAVDAEGSLHGITSWLPVYGPGGAVRGWTLDLMRRREDGFGPVMEFLIGASALHFAEQGAEFISLSGVPLVRPAEAEAGPVERVLDRLGELIEPLYGFRSLQQFKQKFNPRSEPLYLLYRDEGDLPRIALALTRAYLPDSSLRDLVTSATRG